ncbi:MAG: 50S ribosomal protein L9 [Oscillospiraceae bacterium]|jgi:large subunit ribosomal protein L9|nr:50S ribosomal protein L9 [Oscillospiraceae bacterium]
MKVVLKEDIKGTGKKGELVNVSDGYARNYLFPRKLAAEANAQALNDIANKDRAEQHRLLMEKKAADELKEKLDGKTIKITAKAGQNGKLFGSITSKEIAEAINKKYSVDLDKRKITVSSDIKTFGTYECEVKIYAGVSAKVFVVVGEE